MSENAKVIASVNELNKGIQELKDQIAAGENVTEADLDEIMEAVVNIYTVWRG